MTRTSRSQIKILSALGVLAALCLHAPVPRASAAPPAQGTEGPAPSVDPSLDIEPQLEQARSHMQALEYEEAIATLEPVLLATRSDPGGLRETYILLIEAHVYRGNLSRAGTKEQELWYEEARGLIRECLGVRELRRTQPDPPEAYPVKMLRFFDEIRRGMFGTFEIGSLGPADAEVMFDGEVLLPVDGVLRQTEVPIGAHVVVVRHPDYREISEDVEISAATVITRSYALERTRGWGWYATRVVVPVAAVVGVVVAATTSGGDEPPPDLPDAPEPPTLR